MNLHYSVCKVDSMYKLVNNQLLRRILGRQKYLIPYLRPVQYKSDLNKFSSPAWSNWWERLLKVLEMQTSVVENVPKNTNTLVSQLGINERYGVRQNKVIFQTVGKLWHLDVNYKYVSVWYHADREFNITDTLKQLTVRVQFTF